MIINYLSEKLQIQITKDFCGVLTEEAFRKNFIMIYEILDEVLVNFYGY
jgi:AP-4 complex subunit mu-1